MSGINGGPNQQPANWRYSIAQGGLSLASYPGNVQFDGIVFDDVSMFSDVASVQAATIPAIVQAISTAGYYSPGDGGGAQYIRAGSSGPGRIQSVGGQWWQPVFPGAWNVEAFGARGNNVFNNSSAFQAVFDGLRLVGGDAVCPGGQFLVDSTVAISYTGQTQEPVTQPLQVNFYGSGAGSTVINKTGTGFAFSSEGGTGVASHIYTVWDGFSFTGATAKGIKLKNHAFTTLSNMTFQGLVTGLELESVLSSKFENLVFGNSTNGVEVFKGTGFSDINANEWNNCTFRNLTGVGYSGGDHSGAYFSAVNVEAVGTQGDALTGGFNMTFTGAEGSTGLQIWGGYFEGNAGGWDINLVNNGAEYVTHTFIGVSFNRISNTNFVTNNIRSVGRNRIVLIGCTFDHFNSYVPDAARLYVNADALTQVVCIGCKFKSPVEQGSLRNIETPLAGSFDGAGAAIGLPSGWTVARTGPGVYVVTHNLNLPTASYVVNATSEDNVTRLVQRVVKGLNDFTIATQDGAGVAADSQVGFLMTIR